ncbi:uncharacterized protein LOC130712830 [Lotus japonicus]|uniref:uncharacterized protein LOC130712830 n=1 Tax=Lotus japonicus TaxID=34305 RepID=UPI00258E50AB|nr:uncharacterized protein LOC130712830 [Lotus japonicus]
MLQHDDALAASFAMLLWAIWKQRNKVMFNNAEADLFGTHRMAVELLSEWQQAGHKGSEQRYAQDDNSTASIVGWKTPPVGAMKINIDAGWTGNDGLGMAMVIRDHEGTCMYAETAFLENRLEPTMAEATALRWALNRAQALELDNIIFESDALTVVNNFNSGRGRAELEPILQDCRMLATQFSVFRLQHVKRDANKVAHILASIAAEYPSHCWWDNFPSQIQAALLADVFSVII